MKTNIQMHNTSRTTTINTKILKERNKQTKKNEQTQNKKQNKKHIKYKNMKTNKQMQRKNKGRLQH